MKRLATSALSVLGVRPLLLRSASQEIVGIELCRATGPSPTRPGIYKVDGCFMLVLNPRDVIQREHAQGRWYEPDELDMIRHHYRGGLVLDVGANVGNHAIWAARMLEAPVLAIEPNPAAYQILRCNIALNDLHGRVRHLPVGLADAPGRAGMDTPDPNNLGMTRLLPGGSGFDLVTGDSVAREERVGFIKVDAERLEMQVLLGLEQTIRRDQPPILVEVEDTHIEAFLSFIHRLGYREAKRHTNHPGTSNYMVVSS